MKLKFILPVLVLVLTVFGVVTLLATGPELKPSKPVPVATAVRIQEVVPQRVQLNVHSQGTIEPRTQTALVPEVSGKVVWVSPNLVSGGYFKENDALLRIDDADYRASVARARASVNRARADNEHARFELQRAKKLDEQKLVSQSAVDTALQSARVTEAALADALVALQQAERDLARTEIKAPFTGLVRSEQVDIGQFVSRGSTIADLYATDYVEVRLPIADQQLAYLNLPLTQRGELDTADSPSVTLTTEFAGTEMKWKGKLVRTEAEIDTMSRMVNAVARIRADAETNEIPPPVGLFVEAEIEGRSVDDVIVFPRSALRENDRVLIVDGDNRIQYRAVKVLRVYKDDVYVSGGLKNGEKLCISPLQTVVSGMQVEPVTEEERETVAEQTGTGAGT